MPDAFHAEFTGERVIPGRVEDNLFNEHLARYRFTARLVEQFAVEGPFLDAGCGAGYGAAELAKCGAQLPGIDVLGIDVSPDAIAHARANFALGSNVRFQEASCTAIPAADGSFRLITAFEVIEHLVDWRDFLIEARRVLDPAGMFLVSTPNRLYYAESREKAGPNPFHVHEFTEEEFRSELSSVFPHVKILLQNHVEGIAFSGADSEGAAFEISDQADEPERAHFFLALCSQQPLPPVMRFVFIPATGNVLQTRERHIALLEGEIQQKNQWIEVEKLERGRMMAKVGEMEAELEQHSRWAQAANAEADRRALLVEELQAQLHKSNEWAKARDAEAVERGQRVEQLQDEVARCTSWAHERDTEAEARGQRIVELQDEAVRTVKGYEAAIAQWRRDKEISDQWARDAVAEHDAALEAFAGRQIEFEIAQERLATLQSEMEQLRAQVAQANTRLDMIAQSRWVRLGRKIRVGPEIART